MAEDGEDDGTRSITLKKIIAYAGGIIFILAGLSGAAQTPAALAMTVGGLFALPNVRRRILHDRLNISLSKWVVTVIVLVLVGAGAGALSAAQPIPTHESGDTFEVGDGDQTIAYTVTNARTGSSVGGQFISEEADGQFIVIDVSMENRGSEPVDISSNQFKLVDGEGNTYEPDTDAMITVDNSVVFEELSPDVSQDGVVVFDVPSGKSGWKLQIEPAGFGSGATKHRVNIDV